MGNVRECVGQKSKQNPSQHSPPDRENASMLLYQIDLVVLIVPVQTN